MRQVRPRVRSCSLTRASVFLHRTTSDVNMAAAEEMFEFDRKLLKVRNERRVFCLFCVESDTTYSEDGYRQHCRHRHPQVDMLRSWNDCKDQLNQRIVEISSGLK